MPNEIANWILRFIPENELNEVVAKIVNGIDQIIAVVSQNVNQFSNGKLNFKIVPSFNQEKNEIQIIFNWGYIYFGTTKKMGFTNVVFNLIESNLIVEGYVHFDILNQNVVLPPENLVEVMNYLHNFTSMIKSSLSQLMQENVENEQSQQSRQAPVTTMPLKQNTSSAPLSSNLNLLSSRASPQPNANMKQKSVGINAMLNKIKATDNAKPIAPFPKPITNINNQRVNPFSPLEQKSVSQNQPEAETETKDAEKGLDIPQDNALENEIEPPSLGETKELENSTPQAPPQIMIPRVNLNAKRTRGTLIPKKLNDSKSPD